MLFSRISFHHLFLFFLISCYSYTHSLTASLMKTEKKQENQKDTEIIFCGCCHKGDHTRDIRFFNVLLTKWKNKKDSKLFLMEKQPNEKNDDICVDSLVTIEKIKKINNIDYKISDRRDNYLELVAYAENLTRTFLENNWYYESCLGFEQLLESNQEIKNDFFSDATRGFTPFKNHFLELFKRMSQHISSNQITCTDILKKIETYKQELELLKQKVQNNRQEALIQYLIKEIDLLHDKLFNFFSLYKIQNDNYAETLMYAIEKEQSFKPLISLDEILYEGCIGLIGDIGYIIDIIKAINNSTHNKIIVIAGANHITRIINWLQTYLKLSIKTIEDNYDTPVTTINLINAFGLMDINQCQHCKITEIDNPIKICTRCKNSFYCSRECQVKDWKNHKKVCKKN